MPAALRLDFSPTYTPSKNFECVKVVTCKYMICVTDQSRHAEKNQSTFRPCADVHILLQGYIDSSQGPCYKIMEHAFHDRALDIVGVITEDAGRPTKRATGPLGRDGCRTLSNKFLRHFTEKDFHAVDFYS